MAKYHINPKTGDPGLCRAQDNCPFGGDEIHFTSESAAREAAETILSDRYGSDVKLEKASTAELAASKLQNGEGLTLQELNSVAKRTADPAVIEDIIARGSERTLNNLAQNPNLTEEQIDAAIDKATTPRVRAILMMRGPKGNFEKMTPEDYEEVVYRLGLKDPGLLDYRYQDQLKNPYVGDDHYRAVIDGGRLYPGSRSANGFASILVADNKITPKLFTKELEANGWRTYPLNPQLALRNGKLDEDTLKRAPEDYLNNLGSTGLHRLEENHLDMLVDVATARRNEKLANDIARSSKITALTLDRLAEGNLSERVDEQVFNHPNASQYTREAISERHPDKPFVRVGNIRGRVGDSEVDALIIKRGGSQLGRAYSETVLTFDMAKAKELGLNRDDLLYLGGAHGHNAGGGFDEESGVLTMRTDSSD